MAAGAISIHNGEENTMFLNNIDGSITCKEVIVSNNINCKNLSMS